MEGIFLKTTEIPLTVFFPLLSLFDMFQFQTISLPKQNLSWPEILLNRFSIVLFYLQCINIEGGNLSGFCLLFVQEHVRLSVLLYQKQKL